jgi:ethylbenzene dioxygenase ferredoxin subunit
MLLYSIGEFDEDREDMNLIKVCETADVRPGEMIPVDVDGFPPLAVYNVGDKFYLTSNICTHNIAILTDGYLEGDIVECPLHGGCFNVRTGEATHFPCVDPLQTFEVEVRDGAVFMKAP